MGYMNHDEPYSEDYIKDILSSVKTIAMVFTEERMSLI